MDANGFAFDLSQKAETFLEVSKQQYDWSRAIGKQIVFIGMGSSHFAASTMTQWLNASEHSVIAVLASARDLPRLTSHHVVVAISASGDSVETLAALKKVPSDVTKIALTNNPNSKVVDLVDHTISLHAGTETGGVASLTYMATLVALLRLLEQRTQTELLGPHVSLVHEALSEIYDSRQTWLTSISELAIGSQGTYCVAPVERLCSAQQSALMLREGPRLIAQACEVGDWSHIDVYLTKTTDYRMVLFSGSQWEQQLYDWTTQRASSVIAIGATHPQAQLNIRYPHDENEIVRLLAEVSYMELTSSHLWQVN